MRLPFHRRTKKAYGELFADPSRLFDNCEVILWPNGDPEIWVRSVDGRRSFAITASDGPAGLGLTIRRSIGGAPVTVSGNLADDYAPAPLADFAEVSLCQYRPDGYAQAFRAWYGASAADRENGTFPYPGTRDEWEASR